MAIQKTDAIVLKARNFRETSLIVNFFTRDFGKIDGIIKGIRSEPQRYGGLPLAFSQSCLVFYGGEKKDLNLITQCDSEEQFQPIRADLQKTNYAHYFVELLDAVTSNYDKNEELFKLMLDSLKALCGNLPNWQVGRTFEIRLLNLSGFKPRLDACVNCQKEITGRPSPEKKPDLTQEGRFSSSLGGMLCPDCFSADKLARPVFKGTLASIDYIEKSTWQKAVQLKMPRNVAEELASILSRFLDIHLDKEIKTRKFLN